MSGIGRNDLCLCGSGKKYKKCCINKKEDLSQNKEFVESMHRALFRMHDMLLTKKMHIRKYKKLRDLHSEVVDSMMNYFQAGNYKWEYTDEEAIKSSIGPSFFNVEFNTNDSLGRQAFPNMLIYNHGLNTPSICEVFLSKNKFRKEEKISFVKDMLNSVESLFEIVSIDRSNGYVMMKDVFNGKEYKITDISMSLSEHSNKFYLYTRIITSNDISFGTGFAMSFMKDDQRIINWIKEHKKTYSKKTELSRFITIYELYKSITDNETQIILNEV